MLIQIHMLQNYAPANLNRDDTGSPKDAIFGGERRGRISSQCLKRSIRHSPVFTKAFDEGNLLGLRTKLLPDLVRKELEELGADSAIIEAIVQRVPAIGKKSTKTEETTSDEAEKVQTEMATKQLIFIGKNEIRPLAERLLALYNENSGPKWKKVELEKSLEGSLPRSVDIALFGRMTTSAAFEDVHAASQVAHAISTNALVQEFDYYTALDDLKPESEPGAEMIGDVEFNSSTYYKYFNVHWEKLVNNLGGDIQTTRHAVLAFIEASATAQPSGKQNSFAAFNLPDVILVEISSRNLPVSYANAFLQPARASRNRTLMQESAAALGDYMLKVSKAYGLDVKRAYMAVNGDSMPAECVENLAALQDWVAAQLPG